MKDPRYDAVRALILNEHIKEFREIFITLPKSTLYHDLGMNNKRFTKMMFHVEKFSFEEVFIIANLIGVDKDLLVKLIMAQHNKDIENKGKVVL